MKTLTENLLDELKLLLLFELDTVQQGIKIHHHAAPERIAAAQRLHAKGLITQQDGGYLTDRGLEAAQHAESLLGLLHHTAVH
jgi:uncharacterized protein (TIGR02647 family)